MIAFPSIKTEHIETLRTAFKELREAYVNRPVLVEKDPFEGLQEL
jgi:hypothetical protein